MKHQYRKSLTYIQWISTALLFALALFICWLLGINEKTLLKTGVGCFGLLIVQYVRFSREMLNRYVELYDDHILFNSFRFRDVKMKPAVSLNVNFEDIWSIEAKTLPIIGIWAISVEGSNLPHKVTLSFCFEKHKELTRNLCDSVNKHNSKVFIDPRLTEYIK